MHLVLSALFFIFKDGPCGTEVQSGIMLVLSWEQIVRAANVYVLVPDSISRLFYVIHNLIL